MKALRSPLRLALLLTGLLLGPALPAPARAAAPAEPAALEDAPAELARIQTDFEYGKFAEVLAAAEARLDRGGLSDAGRLELHRLAGLSAFNVERREVAERHFRSALRLDPDLSLDPFRVPSSTIAFFTRLREQMAGELDSLRAEKAQREARERREEELRALERSEVEVLRRRVEELTRQVTVRTVEKRSLLVNFLPFGAGQFQQGRNGLGIALAASQGALAATSLVAYLARGSLRQPYEEAVNGRVGEDVVVRTVWRVPPNLQRQDQRWAITQLSTGIGFYGLYVFGVVDALLQHRDEVVRTSVESLPPAAPGPSAGLSVSPLPGGASATLSLRF